MTFAAETTPSGGMIVWLPVACVLVTALIVAAVITVRVAYRDDDGEFYFIGGLLATVALLVIGGTAFGMWPYKAEYHQWRTTSGTVAAIDSRVLADGEGMTQRFVVTFTDGRQRACDDTRCATVHTGDFLTLRCKRAYQWGATPGWDCNWDNNRPKAAK